LDKFGLFCVEERWPIGPWIKSGEKREVGVTDWELQFAQLGAPTQGTGSGPAALALVDAFLRQLRCGWIRTLTFEQDYKMPIATIRVCDECNLVSNSKFDLDWEFKTVTSYENESYDRGFHVSIFVLDGAQACLDSPLRP